MRNIISSEFTIRFLQSLEMEGTLKRVAMKNDLGLSLEQVGLITGELLDAGLIEFVSVEGGGSEGDLGKIQISLAGQEYLAKVENPEVSLEGESELAAESVYVQGESDTNEEAEPEVEEEAEVSGEKRITGEDLANVLSYIFGNKRSISANPLEHQIMRDKLGVTAERLEQMIEMLKDGDFLELDFADDVIKLKEDAVPYATGEQSIEVEYKPVTEDGVLESVVSEDPILMSQANIEAVNTENSVKKMANGLHTE
jgi:hypothetical protein